ncbi:MAG: signal peptide peptidase SppA [Opitutales bacterium]|jgi:protease-4
MAEFIIRVLKWLAALVTAYFLLFLLVIFGFMMIGVAFQPVPRKLDQNSVLVLDLRLNLTEQPSMGSPAALIRDALSGELSETVTLRQVLEGLEKAARDPDVGGLLLQGNLTTDGYGGSFAALGELRRSIRAFSREKPVWALVRGDSLKDYYIKSAATNIVSDPFAMVDFRGLRAERLYWGDAFERIGIEVQVSAYEEYKTAAETFKEGAMSPQEREQMTDVIDDIWETLLADMAASRGVREDDLDKLAQRNLILYGEELTHGHLSDEAMNVDELESRLAREFGTDPTGETFRQLGFTEYLYLNTSLASALEFNGSGNKVAILYIEGIIVDGKGDDGAVGADTVNAHIRELRKDESVRAVVVRVNSPGGSASASSRIARELELTRGEKPLVISMGGVAASGGYMVSAPGDHIFIEPSCITGSIGVVSMLPNIEKLAGKLSLNFDGVETHPFAGAFSLSRTKSEEEMRQLRSFGARIYEDFLKLVAVNREMSLKDVRELAKGRIWSGKAALELGLADSGGGLLDAVQKAAEMAGIGNDYRIVERPRLLTFEEQLEEMLGASQAERIRTAHGPGLRSALQAVEKEFIRLRAFDDPHGQYTILPYSISIH